MSHSATRIGIKGSATDGALRFVSGAWTSQPLNAGSGPADTAIASSYSLSVSYGGGGAAYPLTATYWAFNLAVTGSFSRQYFNGASFIAGTIPPSYGTVYPQAVSLPAGEYLSIFSCNNGTSTSGTYAHVRQYSTKTDGTDGVYHGHETRIDASGVHGGLNIARLSFSTTRYLYLRGVVFGGASAFPDFNHHQPFGLQIVRLN